VKLWIGQSIWIEGAKLRKFTSKVVNAYHCWEWSVDFWSSSSFSFVFLPTVLTKSENIRASTTTRRKDVTLANCNHNSAVCTAPSTSPRQDVLRFVHNSFSGLSLSNSSWSSSVPTNTARNPLNCSAASIPSAVLQIGLLQLSQKKVTRVIPFSCFSVYVLGSPASNLNCSFFTKTHVELVLPVVLWQALQWQRNC
jgi:hypothetical protein